MLFILSGNTLCIPILPYCIPIAIIGVGPKCPEEPRAPPLEPPPLATGDGLAVADEVVLLVVVLVLLLLWLLVW